MAYKKDGLIKSLFFIIVSLKLFEINLLLLGLVLSDVLNQAVIAFMSTIDILKFH